jgi:hypothetical protein
VSKVVIAENPTLHCFGSELTVHLWRFGCHKGAASWNTFFGRDCLSMTTSTNHIQRYVEASRKLCVVCPRGSVQDNGEWLTATVTDSDAAPETPQQTGRLSVTLNGDLSLLYFR